jgi:hypothetical protein
MKINTSFEFQFIPFILAFIIGIIYIVITNNTKEKIVKTPTPFSNNLYSDFDGECYRLMLLKQNVMATNKSSILLYKF